MEVRLYAQTHTHTHPGQRSKAPYFSNFFDLVRKATIFCCLKKQPVFEGVIV